MKKEIDGIALSSLEAPIHDTLVTFMECTDNRVVFGDLNEATQLQLTPEKTTSARSTSSVLLDGRKIATATIIAFAHKDATGDTRTHDGASVVNYIFPDEPKYYPRSKENVDTEVYLPLLSQESGQETPVLFAGHLKVMGLVEDKYLAVIGHIGQAQHEHSASMARGYIEGKPAVTQTTGYRGELQNLPVLGERFGDPHAILSDFETGIQAGMFFGLTGEHARRNLRAFTLLGASEPRLDQK